MTAAVCTLAAPASELHDWQPTGFRSVGTVYTTTEYRCAQCRAVDTTRELTACPNCGSGWGSHDRRQEAACQADLLGIASLSEDDQAILDGSWTRCPECREWKHPADHCPPQQQRR